MPVPKRKTSKSRRDKRSASKFIRPTAITQCLNCEYPINPHEACAQCGMYKGKKVLKTKLDRAIQRGKARQAKQERHAHLQQQQQEHAESSHAQE